MTSETVRTSGMDVQPGRYVRAGRISYAVLAFVFVGSITVQVFLAGMGVFVSPEYWEHHRLFVHFIAWQPFLMVAAAFVGRMTRTLTWSPVGLFALVALLHGTADLRGSAVAALHPVVGMLMFGAAAVLAIRAWRAL